MFAEYKAARNELLQAILALAVLEPATDLSDLRNGVVKALNALLSMEQTRPQF